MNLLHRGIAFDWYGRACSAEGGGGGVERVSVGVAIHPAITSRSSTDRT